MEKKRIHMPEDELVRRLARFFLEAEPRPIPQQEQPTAKQAS